jgi:hypothetical protein
LVTRSTQRLDAGSQTSWDGQSSDDLHDGVQSSDGPQKGRDMGQSRLAGLKVRQETRRPMAARKHRR